MSIFPTPGKWWRLMDSGAFKGFFELFTVLIPLAVIGAVAILVVIGAGLWWLAHHVAFV